jgi:antitoxin (DNA-binding transcriptional repressor) of toxin-antitoxin stability system
VAIVKMRELLRNPKPVFAELERSGEPILLTRDGQAIAALVPVNPERAEEFAMAALPEFVDSRARARDARREGRTASGADLLADFEARQRTGGSEPPPVTPAVAPVAQPKRSSDSPEEVVNPLAEHMTFLFGDLLSRDLAGAMAERIAMACEPVLEAAPREIREQDAARADFTRRVQQLNCELFGRLLPDTLERTTLSCMAGARMIPESGRPAASAGGGVFGRPLAVATLDAVTARVESFNRELMANRLGPVSLPFYEACVRGVQAMKSSDVPAQPAPMRLDLPAQPASMRLAQE